MSIGIAAVGDIDVRKKAHVFMEELGASTGETVHLFVLEGGSARIIDGVGSPQAVRVATAIGALYPAHATAGGKALLAALPGDQLRAMYSRGLPRFTDFTQTRWEAFEPEIEMIRRQGFAVNRGEAQDGVCGVAVPIFDRARRLVASLALSVPRDRINDERIENLATELRHHAADIGEVLV
ncbi:IclR family transcriptional regulator [Paenarthrobacter sp. NPDC090520]|uniref:IclR family transcriptional regulator n=1 Tax=unclassified Paenarthrobacter TaxID=2634190 RepID=UPI00382BAC11